MPRIKSLWEGIAKVSVVPEATATTQPLGEPSGIVEFMQRVFQGRMQVWQMSHVPIEGDENPIGSDVYALDPFEVRMIMASVAPSSLSLPGESIPVQLDSPFNDANITRAAVERLSAIGLAVALIRETASTPEKNTTFFYSDQVIVEIAERKLEAVVGPVNFEKLKQPVEGIGAHVVIGTTFRDFIAANPVVPTTTTIVED